MKEKMLDKSVRLDDRTGVSRRRFLQGAAATSVLAGAALAGCAPNSKRAPSENAWDEEFDLVVIGCGGAGAAAAIIAHDAGASVVVLEKGDQLGGSTALCGQAIIGVNTKIQKAAGIEDTVDEALKYFMAAGDGDETLLRAMLEESGPAVDWLIDLGMQVPAEIGSPGLTMGGQEKQFAAVTKPVARTHWSVTPKPGMWPVLQQALDDRSIDTRTKTPAVTIIQNNETQEVQGVVAEDRGKKVRIKAKKAVIIAAGGYTRNPEMERRLIAKFPIITNSNICDEGDGMNLGIGAGASVGWFGFLKNVHLAKPDSDTAVSPCLFVILGSEKMEGKPPFILSNLGGKRFSNERQFYSLVCEDLLKQPEGRAYVITGGPAAKAGLGAAFDIAAQGDTVEQLAQKVGIDGKELALTVAEWNSNCAAGSDLSFGRKDSLFPIDTPPYYAAEVRPGTGTTFGGVLVDTKARALSAATNEPIPRLYACGNSGTFLGRYYPSCGAATCAAITAGRLAAADAVTLEDWK
ncbi:MAG: FAD-binding protein [Raoultibacter sp.]